MALSAFEQLEKGARQEYGRLIELHDRFAVSADPFMRYAAGWAAMYAAQRAVRLSEVIDVAHAQQMANERWAEIDGPKPTMYEADPDVIHAQAKLALALSDQICQERREWTETERRVTTQKVAEVALDCLPVIEAGNATMIGELAEIACLQLMWRPTNTEADQQIFNGVPAGPAKDQRAGKGYRYATDIYALPAGKSRDVKHVNVQMKTVLRETDYSRYDKIIALIGANTHFAHNRRGEHDGQERIRFTVEACTAEAADGSDEEYTPTLDVSSSKVHKTIHRKFLIRNPSLQTTSSAE